jgi:6-pyruvoyltetrahydropterin/6-carboxytetrahydropterin synthase
MSDGAYSTGTAATVRAYHLMPGMPPPEGERHAHDYRLDLVVSRGTLDERGMVVDLDVLDAALRGVLDRVADADLGGVVGAEAVTVEVFARWVWDTLADALGAQPAVLRVRVWESQVAFGGYEAALG